MSLNPRTKVRDAVFTGLAAGRVSETSLNSNLSVPEETIAVQLEQLVEAGMVERTETDRGPILRKGDFFER